jgi:hypothetical protein
LDIAGKRAKARLALAKVGEGERIAGGHDGFRNGLVLVSTLASTNVMPSRSTGPRHRRNGFRHRGPAIG